MKNIHCRLTACAAMVLLSACGGGGGGAGGGPAASNSAPTESPTSAVSGSVLDAAGNPVAGATVSAYHHNSHSTVSTLTDARGRYTVAGLGSGNFTDFAFYVAKPGLAFSMAVNDTAGSVQRFDFDGQYRGVIRFETLPAREVTSANFVAWPAGTGRVKLPRTGQTRSEASGDDAAVARGVAWPAQRFVDAQDGTVTDTLTGLVWLKNAGCLPASGWAAALAAATGLAPGQCGLSDGSHAGQWRVPNANELESLVDVGQTQPALSAGHPFTGVDQARAYWSSTTYTASTRQALAIRFTDGRWINGVDAGDAGFNNSKAGATNAVWAVRDGSTPGAVALLATGAYAGVGGASFAAGDDAALQKGVPLNSPRFIDNGDGTLSDSMTGLTWLKKADCLRANWTQALGQVAQLASGVCGLNDGSRAGQWRMPNRAEMLSLSDRAPTFPQAAYFNGQYRGDAVVVGPAIFERFIVFDYYWTSTTVAADATQAWSVYSCDFGVYNNAKSDLRYALAVR